MLPEGWKLSCLGDACFGALQTGPFGSQLHAHEYTEHGVSVLMPKDLTNYRANIETAAKISIEKSHELKRHQLNFGDILFSRRGDVARLALIDDNSKGSLCGTGCLRARPSTKIFPGFLFFFLQLPTIKSWLEHNAVGQTMPNMNTEILYELPLLLPPLPEQKKIAAILSTWDRAIEGTEKLLANSQQQKKALMQQLLTGKKRLPGFTGEWEKTNIGNIAKEISIRNKNRKDYPVISCTKTKGFVDSLSFFNKKVYSDDLSGYKIISRNQIGFPSNHVEEGSIGLQNLHDDAIVSPIYTIFSMEENADPLFVFAVLKTDHYRQIFAAATNSSVDRRGSLRWSAFSQIKINLPSLSEQKAIAAVLTTADEEITALESDLTRLRQEKKALMQQLLTGKRRVTVD